MSQPATLAPVRQPLYTEPSLVLVQGGLFAAPWLGLSGRDEVAAVAELSRTLAVKGHCLEAAQAAATARARSSYREALRACHTALNQLLTAVTDAHRRALVDSVGWGLLNLLFMASMPLNGFWHSELPWSVPFVLAVPLLWWVTWDRPYKTGLRFFDYLRAIKAESLAAFHQAAQAFPDPEGQFRTTVAELLPVDPSMLPWSTRIYFGCK